MNRTFVIGNLGAKPETRHLEGGSVVSKFNVASSRKYTNKKGETVNETEWFRFEAWGKLAEIVDKYLDKGSQVYVEGRMRTEKYKDKDGVEKTVVKFVADNLKMLGRTESNAAGGTNHSASTAASGVTNSNQSPTSHSPAFDEFGYDQEKLTICPSEL